MNIQAMDGPFGALVDGFDISVPPDPLVMRRLVDALYEHRILVLRDQHPDRSEYVRFGRQWGEPIAFFVPSARDNEYPEIIRIRNSPKTPLESRDGAMHWHADSSYEAVPAAVTMLLAEEAPEDGNDTLFADCIAAYDALPTSTKQRIADLEVVHDPNGGKVAMGDETRGRGGYDSLPVVTHPLVARHPGTGRPTLYGFSGTAAGIVGMDDDEAIGLLLDLKRHVLQPRFQQRARAAVGTILIWDNYGVVHSASPTEYSDEDGKRRLLHRISTRGLPAVLGVGV